VSPLLILAIVVGLLLPLAIAVAIVLFAAPKGSRANWGLVFAFGKGVGLGIVLGLTVSAIVIALVLALAELLGR
jgi:hypothetical protein